jgi:hypothetical protein
MGTDARLLDMLYNLLASFYLYSEEVPPENLVRLDPFPCGCLEISNRITTHIAGNKLMAELDLSSPTV